LRHYEKKNWVERFTLSNMDMMPAIESFLAIIPQQLAKGNIIELGDFGNFWLKSSADGAEDPSHVRSDQITSLLPRFMPGKKFKKSLEDTKFEKA
jgi:nucleoid DNA-binding protein